MSAWASALAACSVSSPGSPGPAPTSHTQPGSNGGSPSSSPARGAFMAPLYPGGGARESGGAPAGAASTLPCPLGPLPGSTRVNLRRCTCGSLLPRRFPEQPGRCEPQRGEEQCQDHDDPWPVRPRGAPSADQGDR